MDSVKTRAPASWASRALTRLVVLCFPLALANVAGAQSVTLELPMATPRFDALEATVPLSSGGTADVLLELRFDEKGKLVSGGLCLVDGVPVMVKGKVSTKGTPIYSLKLKGDRVSASIRGELVDGEGFASIRCKTPRGSGKEMHNAVMLSTTPVMCRVTMEPRLDSKGKVGGQAFLDEGFGGGPPVVGELKGKGKGDQLAFSVKLGKHKLAFKGTRAGASSSFAGDLKYSLLPEKGVMAGFSVDLGSYCPDDLDCDQLTDGQERLGWDVTVTLADGAQQIRVCPSDPFRRDTDGDGLDDRQELMARTDPERADTDDDGLNDRSELYAYKSNPVMVDSDGDSRGPDGTAPSDPNLWDGNELALTRTSPTLDDTDGDGFTDWEEIHGGGTSPRVADLPVIELRLYTDPDLVLNIVATTGEQHIMSSLEQRTSEYQKTDTTSTRMAIENTVQIHTEVEVGTACWPPSASAKMTTDTRFEHSYVNETSSSWTQGSVNDAKDTFNQERSRVTQFQNGIVKLGMKIANNSNVAVLLSDPRVIATRFTPGGSFRSVGTLAPGDMVYDAQTKQQSWVPDAETWEMEMAPGEEVVVEIGDGAVPAQTMEAILSDPTALMFEIGSYALFSPDMSRNYVEVGQDVIARTGVVVIDFGDGVVERHAVATNVYRNPDSSDVGVTLREALDEILDVDYDTCLEEAWTDWPSCETRAPTGRTILCRVRNRTAYGDCGDFQRGFWIVGGNGAAFEGEPADFDEIVLHNGERVTLVWVEDSDGDGLFDREEYLLGTDDASLDTDADDIDDYTESRVGWLVQVEDSPAYRVYPDPRFVDVDDDSLSDGFERYLGTDPYLKDTDGDGDPDDLDPDPLSPPCLEGGEMLIAAWWDGGVKSVDGVGVARDAWTEDGRDTVGTFSRPGIPVAQGGDDVFRFVNLQTSEDFIAISNDASLGPTQQYTVSAWINWGGVGGGQQWGLVLGKGLPDVANYAIYVSSDGKLRHTMRRNYHTKCVQCSIFGCSDPLCADDSGVDTQTLETSLALVPPNTWVHVAATYVDQVMTLYLDGAKVAEMSTVSTWQSGLNHRTRTTTSLVANGSPLTIGGDTALPAPYGPYRGLVDDVQIFHRGLNAGQIKLIYRFGVCEP